MCCRKTKRSLSSRRDASNSLLARGKLAMCIYRQKLKPILQKRVARSYCSPPPRRSACSTNHRQRRLDFFTLPVENNKAFFHLHVRVGRGDVSAMSALGHKRKLTYLARRPLYTSEQTSLQATGITT